jgi:peptidoglycan hydrolase-like protein with peptidoglycan-binding domain
VGAGALITLPRQMRRLITLSSLAALAAAGSAFGQEPTTTTPPPPPAPAAGQLSVVVDKVGKFATTVAGTRWRVRGDISPYVAGQEVVVRVYRDGKKFLAKRAKVTPGATGGVGHFKVPVRTGVSGPVTVRVSKPATATQGALKAPAQHVLVLPAHVTPGATGNAVRVMQRELRALGYVPGRRGVFDARTGRAILAFRKVSGLARTTIADHSVFRRMAAGGGRFEIRYPGHGKHVEADLSLQVLALIDHGKVRRIYPTSSGKPSTPTVLGHYRFYSKTPGFNSHEMYFSNYFIGGYAIHGYYDVPVYNASHGCLRVPNPDAKAIYDWVRIGDRIDVYR